MNLQELLGEELHREVQEKLKKAKVNVKLIINDGSFIPRERLNKKNKKITLLEVQLKDIKNKLMEKTAQFENLKNNNKANEELKYKIKVLQAQYFQAMEEYISRIQLQELDYQTEVRRKKYNNARDFTLLFLLKKLLLFFEE